jgi:chromosome segregation ATPase
MGSLKREFLELLEKDLEFRYAVAGYLGLSEVLKRLDTIAEEQKSLREEQVNLREEQTKIWSEIVTIKEEQVKLRMEQVRLREDFNRMLALIDRMDTRLSRVERTLEKLTIDVEDEAKSFLKHRLRELGISVESTSPTLPDLELNIYGASEEVCIIGEATIRAGVNVLEELMNKLEKLKRIYPDRLRRKTILVIYASLPTAELIEEAKKRRIWLLKATEEFHKPEKLFIEN